MQRWYGLFSQNCAFNDCFVLPMNHLFVSGKLFFLKSDFFKKVFFDI